MAALGESDSIFTRTNVGVPQGTTSKRIVEPEPSRTAEPQWKVIRAGGIVIAQGWECPRCGLINAPHTSHCSCRPMPRPQEGATTLPQWGTFTGAVYD